MADLWDVGVPSLFVPCESSIVVSFHPKFRACHFLFARSSYCS